MGLYFVRLLAGEAKMLILEIPYPPSVNHYYRRVGNRMLISREWREYRATNHGWLVAGRR